MLLEAELHRSRNISVIAEPAEAQPYWSVATVTPSVVCLTSCGSSDRIYVDLTSNSPKFITLPLKAVLPSLQVASEVTLQTLCPV